MKKIIITLAIALSFNGFIASAAPSAKPSDNYKIELTVKGMKSTETKKDSAYLAYYMNGKTYSKDTVQLNSKGYGVFTKKHKLDEGIYIVYFNSEKYFDLLVGKDQHITINVDIDDLKNAKIGGAIESVDFQNYMTFLTEMNKERSELVNKYKEKKIDSTQ